MISFLPEHFLAVAILCLLSYCCISNLSQVYNFPKLHYSIVFITIAILVNFIGLNIIDLPLNELYFNNFFLKNQLSYLIQIIMSIVLILILCNIHKYNKNHYIDNFEFYIVLLFAFLSLVLLISSREIISFFFLLELQGFSFYILASFMRDQRNSIESGLKYLILSSFSSLLILLGFSLIYANSGLMNFTELYYFVNTYSNNNIFTMSFILVSSGFLFKLYNFPFHFWISDIYQGSPMSSVAIFSTIPLLSIFYSFYVIIFYIYYNIITDIKYLFIILSISTMIIGTLFALYQRKIKRLLAYSSVSNIGYIITSIINDNINGIHNSLIFICVYILNLVGIFVIFLNLFDNKIKINIENLYLLKGFFKTHKNISIVILIHLFSLAGIPPFSSFFSKLFLISSLYNESFYMIILVMIITTFLGAFYYIRIAKTMTYNDNNVWFFIKPFSFITSSTLVLFILFQIYFGLFPSMFTLFTYNGILDFYI